MKERDLSLESEPSKLVREWIERGKGKSVVGGYGTSIEVLKSILDTRTIKGYPDEVKMKYMHDLTPNGEQIYHLVPFFSAIEKINPYFAIQIFENYRDRSHEFVTRELNMLEGKRVLRDYAIRNAIEKYFESQFGIKTGYDEILEITKRISIDDFYEYCDQLKNEGLATVVGDALSSEDYDRLEVRHILQSLKRKKIAPVLPEIFQRRGVIIYFGEQVLSHKTYVGQEDEGEIIVISQMSLDLSHVYGIEPLSSHERKLILNWRF